MLRTLSLRNASRQAKDYLIYFITMIISVALIYAFNGLVFSKEIATLGGMMAVLPMVIVGASLVMIFIIGWLVAYTINFILHKRSKELGTYMLLGIEQKQVAEMFLIENIVIGSIALVIGIVVGNVLYQFVHALILYNFGLPFHLTISFSLGTVGMTLLYFIGIYLFALFRSRRKIARMKVYDLLHYDKRNEEIVINAKKGGTFLCIVSVLAGMAGLFLIATGSSWIMVLLGIILSISFLFGFFVSVSSFASHYLDTHVSKKYQGNKLFILRTLLSKISTMSVTMATLSLLFSVTLAGIGSGMLLNTMFDSRVEKDTSYDLAITSYKNTEFIDFVNYVNNSGIDVKDSYIYSIYQSDTKDYTKGIEERGEKIPNFDKDCLMKISDYNRIRQLLDLPVVLLEEGKYIIHCIPGYKDELEDYVQSKPIVSINNHSLRIQEFNTELFHQQSWNGNGNGFILVVPDELITTQPILHSIYAVMTNEVVTEETYNEIMNIVYAQDEDQQDYVISKEMTRITYASSYVIMVFPLYYLALIVLMVAATILSIQHLSEMDKNMYRYQTLSKLGVDKRALITIMRKQLGIYFFLPAAPALVISMVIIHTFAGVFDPGVIKGALHVWSMIGIAIGTFTIIYIIYIIATYTSCKRNIIE